MLVIQIQKVSFYVLEWGFLLEILIFLTNTFSITSFLFQLPLDSVKIANDLYSSVPSKQTVVVDMEGHIVCTICLYGN